MEQYIVAHVDSAWFVLRREDDATYSLSYWAYSREDAERVKQQRQEEQRRERTGE